MGYSDDADLTFRAGWSPAPVQQTPRPQGRWLGGLVGVAVLSAAVVWGARASLEPKVTDGWLEIETAPAGASVEVDGSLRGLTPLTLQLPPGQYAVAVRHEGRTQTITASVDLGVHRVHHIEWPARPTTFSPGSYRGRLLVLSEPEGATVTVDGVARGISPLSVEDLEPGEHRVVVQHLGMRQERIVRIESGATASLVIDAPPAEPDFGWLAVRSSTPLLIYDEDRLAGTTESNRIRLRAGRRTIELTAEPLGFRTRQELTITPGQTTTTAVSLPQAPVDLHAEPWAEAWIDGQSIGATPIAGLALPIGTHRVTFRHPDLGEKHRTITVSLKEPVRVAVDMRER